MSPEPQSPFPIPEPFIIPGTAPASTSPFPIVPSTQVLTNLANAADRNAPLGQPPVANVKCDNFHERSYRELYNRVQKINAGADGASVQNSAHSVESALENAKNKIDTAVEAFVKTVSKELPEKWNSAAGRAVLGGSIGFGQGAEQVVTALTGIKTKVTSLASALDTTKRNVKHPTDFQWHNWTSITDNLGNWGWRSGDDHRTKVAQNETRQIIATLTTDYWTGINGATAVPAVPPPPEVLTPSGGGTVPSVTPGGGTQNPGGDTTTKPVAASPAATQPVTAATANPATSAGTTPEASAQEAEAPWMNPAATTAASAVDSPFTAAPGFGSGSGGSGVGSGGTSPAPGVMPAPAPLAANTGTAGASRPAAAGTGRPGTPGMGGMTPPGAGGKKDEDKEHDRKVDLPPDEDAFYYLDAGNQESAAPPVILPPWLKEDPG